MRPCNCLANIRVDHIELVLFSSILLKQGISLFGISEFRFVELQGAIRSINTDKHIYLYHKVVKTKIYRILYDVNIFKCICKCVHN
jgi:hypothetical protein